MSLRPDDRKGRSRSKSPGRGHERSRSRSHVRAPSPGPQYYGSSAERGHGGGAAAPQYTIRQPGQPYQPAPGSEPITMGNYSDLPPEQRPGYMPPGQAHPPPPAPYAYAPNAAAGPRSPSASNVAFSQPGNVQYAPTNYSYSTSPAQQAGPVRTPAQAGSFQYAPPPDQIKFTAKPVVPVTKQPMIRHTSQPTSPPYQVAQPHYGMPHAPPPPPAAQQQQTYPPPPAAHEQQAYPPPPMGAHSGHHRGASHSGPPSSYDGHHRGASHSGPSNSYDGHKIVEMVPGGAGQLPPPPGRRPHSLSVGGGPDGLAPRMERLSVSGNRPDIHTLVPGGGMPGGFPGGGLPPPSPLLEAYHGTYQSLSPMPHAMMMDDDLDHLPPLDSLSPRGSSASFHGGGGGGGGGGSRRRAHSSAGRSPSPARKSKRKDKLALAAYSHVRDDRDKEKRRVKIYDAEEDALALVDAMSARPLDPDPLIDILPALSHDQMLELRSEYKRHCKVQGRGINIAKHIKLKTTGNFGKIAYVTALGRYESEGYWANYWYQSNGAKRELLIEALMGRQNFEIREIKDAFRDKRYGDSLTKCMDKELKADKFRKAILMALDGERQEESEVWPTDYRNKDVDMLYKAMQAREGGESAMLEVVVLRSDAHLREVLRTYERKYQGSFARDALRKSNNLVGEVVAHILNGVINRPARDAMLLHHALMDLIEPPASKSSRDPSSTSSKHERQQRYELLISRLVRLHWDRMHLSRVKMEYEEKYGHLVEEDVEEATKADFREFCLSLCQGNPGR